MDQKINAYIESLVMEVLEVQKDLFPEKIRDHFHNVVFDVILEHMSTEDLNSIKDIPMESEEMAQRIEEISSGIPFLLVEIEKKLKEEVEAVKNNPSFLKDSEAEEEKTEQ